MPCSRVRTASGEIPIGVGKSFVPAGAVIPEHNHVVLCRIALHPPLDEVGEHLRIASVRFTEIGHFVGLERRSFLQMKAPCLLADSFAIELCEDVHAVS